MFNSKIINIGAVCLFVALLYTQYNKIPEQPHTVSKLSTTDQEAKYKITIDTNKKYEDLKWWEKWILKSSGLKDRMEKEAANTKLYHVISTGESVKILCTTDFAEKFPWCNGEMQLKVGEKKISDHLEFVLQGMKIGDIKVVNVIDENDPSKSYSFQIAVKELVPN